MDAATPTRLPPQHNDGAAAPTDRSELDAATAASEFTGDGGAGCGAVCGAVLAWFLCERCGLFLSRCTLLLRLALSLSGTGTTSVEVTLTSLLLLLLLLLLLRLALVGQAPSATADAPPLVAAPAGVATTVAAEPRAP